ncbi:MAG: HAMP domain-containing sensor histidine kinase [Vampirovibrionales bacterium]|nr:HAMP domain-containing sensor histidine kinase [Vampirovibrionales bacterium]
MMTQTPESSAITTHELRNQLGVLMLHLEIARLQSETLEGEESLQAALKAASTAATQMSHLLEAPHLKAAESQPFGVSKNSLNYKPLALSPWLTEQVEMMIPACEKAGVTLSLKVPNQPLSAMADDMGLTQVLLNLLKNALEAFHTPSHNPEAARIMVVLSSSEPSKAVLSIKDNGLGFSAAQAARLFEAGVSHKANGSGIGLWLSRHIIEAHGGSLTLQSEGLGRGCTACITLPIFVA